MYRNKPQGYFYNIVLHQGGLGDAIGQLPAIKYILDHHPQNFYHIWIHDYFVPICEKLFGHYKNVDINPMSKQEELYKPNLPARSPYGHRVSNLASHITEQSFYTMVGRSVEDKYKNYIQMDPIDVSSFKLPAKYAIMTTGFTSETREWLPKIVNEVSDYLVSIGITPVYIGKSYTQAYKEVGITGNFTADYSKGINLIDSTDLFQAHSIMAGAQMVLGLDNGLLHLANMSMVPCIWAFTTVDPLHRLPFRNNSQWTNAYTVTPDPKTLACTFCQSQMNFAPQDHSFTSCFYKDNKCLEELTTDKWIAQVQKVLDNKKD